MLAQHKPNTNNDIIAIGRQRLLTTGDINPGPADWGKQ